jgi:hypothetical protein
MGERLGKLCKYVSSKGNGASGGMLIGVIINDILPF